VAWERGTGDLGNPVQPLVLGIQPSFRQMRSPISPDVVISAGEAGPFGVDGAETFVGPAVLGVPLQPVVSVGSEFFEVFAAAGGKRRSAPALLWASGLYSAQRCLTGVCSLPGAAPTETLISWPAKSWSVVSHG
jgi:hypothetical protein